jgi:hypothetical protein
VRRVKRVGFELQITREMELVRGGVGVRGEYGEQAALAGDREGGAARWRARVSAEKTQTRTAAGERWGLCWGYMTSGRGEEGSYMHRQRWTLDSDWVHGCQFFGRSAGLGITYLSNCYRTTAAVCCCRLLISLAVIDRMWGLYRSSRSAGMKATASQPPWRPPWQ